jgi:membrane protein implicated in regulation of membrane protease activity
MHVIEKIGYHFQRGIKEQLMPKEPGTWLIIAGIVLIIIGVLASSGLLGWFGRLPGDIRIEREHWRFYFPIATMILLSVLLSVLLYLFRKFW